MSKWFEAVVVNNAAFGPHADERFPEGSDVAFRCSLRTRRVEVCNPATNARMVIPLDSRSETVWRTVGGLRVPATVSVVGASDALRSLHLPNGAVAATVCYSEVAA